MDLYRLYDAQGDLLYIGISYSAIVRLSQHKQDKKWFCDVARMERESLGNISRREAERLEREAIIRERPRHNVTHNQVEQQQKFVIQWRCQFCKVTIKRGAGYIQMPYSERVRFDQEMEEHKALHPDYHTTSSADTFKVWEMSDILALPHEMRWQITCTQCDPEPDDCSYWFEVGRCATPDELADWNRHLTGKNWVQDSDWSDRVMVIALHSIALPAGRAA